MFPMAETKWYIQGFPGPVKYLFLVICIVLGTSKMCLCAETSFQSRVPCLRCSFLKLERCLAPSQDTSICSFIVSNTKHRNSWEFFNGSPTIFLTWDFSKQHVTWVKIFINIGSIYILVSSCLCILGRKMPRNEGSSYLPGIPSKDGRAWWVLSSLKKRCNLCFTPSRLEQCQVISKTQVISKPWWQSVDIPSGFERATGLSGWEDYCEEIKSASLLEIFILLLRFLNVIEL